MQAVLWHWGEWELRDLSWGQDRDLSGLYVGAFLKVLVSCGFLLGGWGCEVNVLFRLEAS